MQNYSTGHFGIFTIYQVQRNHLLAKKLSRRSFIPQLSKFDVFLQFFLNNKLSTISTFKNRHFGCIPINFSPVTSKFVWNTLISTYEQIFGKNLLFYIHLLITKTEQRNTLENLIRFLFLWASPKKYWFPSFLCTYPEHSYNRKISWKFFVDY